MAARRVEGKHNVGGAQRNQRNRNQRSGTQAARAVASARGASSGRAKWIVSVIAVVVIAAAVIGGVLITNNNKQAEANDVIKTAVVHSNYPVKAHDGTITAGKPSAKIKLDFYEDYLCPSCGMFNQYYGDDIEKQLEAGKIQVNYHMLPFLDQNSNPPGYSGRAAQAAYSVAVNSPDKFPSFERSLYNDQPEEQSAGYTNDQLASLGKRLGVGGSFDQDVHNAKYKDTINKSFKQAIQVMKKVDKGSVATPTIVHNGQSLKVLGSQQHPKTNWLPDLLKKEQG